MARSLDSLTIAIVNPLTLVGNELKTLLNERGIPFVSIELLDSTGQAEGALTEVNDEAAIVSPISEERLAGTDIVFFCGPPAGNEVWIRRAETDGFLAIDLSQPSSMSDEAPAIVAGVNMAALDHDPQIVVSPHPVAVTLSLILNPLRAEGRIMLCAASVMQPASEFDKAGIDELFEQTIKALNMQAIPKEIFDRQLAFNSYPVPGAATIEDHIVGQVNSVMGEVPLTVSMVQGTAFHAHTFSIFVQLEGEIDPAAVKKRLGQSPGLSIDDDENGFSTLDAAGKDTILIGRIERDRRIAGGCWIWAAADNLRRSSALNAVLLVEEWISRWSGTVN